MKRNFTLALQLTLTSALTLLTHAAFAQGAEHALDFNGPGVVQVQNDNTLNFGTSSDFTIEFWMKARPTQFNAFTQLVGKNNGYGSRGYNVVTDNSNGKLRFLIDWGSSRVVETFVGSPNLLDNQYHHISVVFDRDDQVEGFVDGVSVGTFNITASNGQNIDNTRNVWIGNFELWNNQLNGVLDEVRIWNRTLTTTEIRSNMCQKLNGNETGLVTYFNMNEGIDNSCSGGEDVCDLTGNGNHGTKF